MSTSNTHQESLVDAGSETRPPILDRSPYEFIEFTPSETEEPRMQTEEDLRGDDLKHYEAEIEAMNLILIFLPNDIYNYVDACTTTQAMWERVERLMRGIVQNKVDRETHFNNEFDLFVAEPGEALVSVYNCFAQLMKDLERNGIKFPKVTVNTKFLNCLQLEWLKYVTQVRLAKRLTEDTNVSLCGGLESVSIWRIQCVGYVVLGFSWSRDHVCYLPEYSHTISPIRRIGLHWIQRIDNVVFVFGEA
ncbi:hypothetical protein Tco_0511853 [Tanacetum coccineum]